MNGKFFHKEETFQREAFLTRMQECGFKNIGREEKGQINKKVREKLISEFSGYSSIKPEVLKGKNLRRVFWAIIDVDNLNDIEKAVNEM